MSKQSRDIDRVVLLDRVEIRNKNQTQPMATLMSKDMGLEISGNFLLVSADFQYLIPLTNVKYVQLKKEVE